MKLRYSQLIGMKVIGADGARIGRIHDLLAEPRGIRWTQVDRIEGRVMRLRVTRAEFLAQTAPPPEAHADGGK